MKEKGLVSSIVICIGQFLFTGSVFKLFHLSFSHFLEAPQFGALSELRML